VPASAVTKQEIENESQIWRSTGIARKRARRSFSRIARKVWPKGERTRRPSKVTAIAKMASRKK